MNTVILFVYLIFTLSEIVTGLFAFEGWESTQENVGEPLILTPLIEQNKIEEAKNKSKVNLENIESFSGYLTVNKLFQSNLFFWLFPARKKTYEEKLVVWIQGEPGRSSLYCIFMENGPFKIESNKNITIRQQSWNNFHSILYIDNPVGTGYSFTNGGYAQNATQVANELYIALMQFFTLFPEYRGMKFSIAGQWLAGKYLPELANKIKTENELKYFLKSLIMINALSDPINQIKYGEYLYQLGLVNRAGKEDFMKKESEFRKKIQWNAYDKAYTIFQELMTVRYSMFKNYTELNDYHYYNYNYRSNKIKVLESYTKDFVTSEAVRSAIHVGNISFEFDGQVEYYIKNDSMKSVAQLVSLLSKDYVIEYYNGQSDIIINFPGTIEFIEKLTSSDRYKMSRTFDRNTGVYTTIKGNLVVNLVLGAGHMIAFDNPRYMYDMIKNL